MSKLPSRSGSLISPFQPTVVRGFSKYTRITISRSSAYLLPACQQPICIFQRGCRIVDRAGADHHDQPVVLPGKDLFDGAAGSTDKPAGFFIQRKFFHQDSRRNQGFQFPDMDVISAVQHVHDRFDRAGFACSNSGGGTLSPAASISNQPAGTITAGLFRAPAPADAAGNPGG